MNCLNVRLYYEVHKQKKTANKNEVHCTYWILTSSCKVSWSLILEADDLELEQHLAILCNVHVLSRHLGHAKVSDGSTTLTKNYQT